MTIRDKILIIEDEPTIANFMRAILEARDYEVMIVQSGAMASTLIASHCPDLIILDLGLFGRIERFLRAGGHNGVDVFLAQQAFSITSGGTKRMILAPAEMITRPFFSAVTIRLPTDPSNSSPCIKPTPRWSFTAAN